MYIIVVVWQMSYVPGTPLPVYLPSHRLPTTVNYSYSIQSLTKKLLPAETSVPSGATTSEAVTDACGDDGGDRRSMRVSPN